jgi:hypothetical protein
LEQFLSDTIVSSVALVSAPRITPSLYNIPTIVVPVFTALGAGKPLLARKAFLKHEINIH